MDMRSTTPFQAALDDFMQSPATADSELISKVTSCLVTLPDEEALERYLPALKLSAEQGKKTITLTVDVSALWYGTQAAIEKIEQIFSGIQSITCIQTACDSKMSDLQFPASVQQLVLKDIQSLPLAAMCAKATQLQRSSPPSTNRIA